MAADVSVRRRLVEFRAGTKAPASIGADRARARDVARVLLGESELRHELHAIEPLALTLGACRDCRSPRKRGPALCRGRLSRGFARACRSAECRAAEHRPCRHRRPALGHALGDADGHERARQEGRQVQERLRREPALLPVEGVDPDRDLLAHERRLVELGRSRAKAPSTTSRRSPRGSTRRATKRC